jgi:prepilin-type N-terminal cleavage/methylation domain-containing protein
MVTAEAIGADPGRRNHGFTLLEIMVGTSVLVLVFLGLFAYASSQRKALNRANQIVDGTRAAAQALELLKGELADSAGFGALYAQAASRPRVRTSRQEINRRMYTVTVTVSRAPAPLYAVKARARSTWSRIHAVELGLLIPGRSDLL